MKYLQKKSHEIRDNNQKPIEILQKMM